MEFVIDNNNYSSFLRKSSKHLIIDDTFIKDNSLEEAEKIILENVKDKSIYFRIANIDLKATEIEISNCEFYSIHVVNSTIPKTTIFETTISSQRTDIWKPYFVTIDNSSIKVCWLTSVTIYNGILIKNGSKIEDITIWQSVIDRFYFTSSTSKKIIFESSTIDEVEITRNDYPVQGAKTLVEEIDIFRTTVNKTIKIWEVKFNKIHFDKIKLLKSKLLTDFSNEILIVAPPTKHGEEGLKIEEIKITGSYINSQVNITVDKLSSFISYDTDYDAFWINFWTINKVRIAECKFIGNIYWGAANRIKNIDEFQIEGCIFENDFSLGNISFEKECSLKSSMFKSYPSFFHRNLILENCKTDFNYSSLENFVFQEVNFKNFTFENLDITNSQFIDCKWIEAKNRFLKRNIVKDELSSNHNVDSLVKVKNIYSKLKTNCQKNSDFINSGKFYISEQEIKRHIHMKNGSWVEYWLLSFHRFISSYGENFKKPLALMLTLLVLFSFVFLFTGFINGDTLVKYQCGLDISNTGQTLVDWYYALVFSLKNIIPFEITKDFFLHSDKTTATTQVLELIHRIINLIFAASFTAAFVKYLRK